ncbi:MAG: C25 family cysteine peptidase [Candidatus Thermoplasmatota archaeon]|nr:C25 family cysteine peptidase [Candidatus Thermoplasmatota archaeon]
MKALVFGICAIMMLGVFAGCTAPQDEQSMADLVSKPVNTVLSAMDLQGKKGVVIPSTEYYNLPILAPVLKNYGLNVSVDWKKDGYADISCPDVSEFSSKIALAFWNRSDMAIVVDNYENSILAGSLASVLNAPILYYGNTTNEALWMLGATNPENIIAIGNVPYAEKANVSLAGQDDIIGFTVSAAKEKGVNLNYITVVNADDETGLQSYFKQKSKTPYTEHLSCFGSIFSAYHNGIVVSVANGTIAPSPEIIDLAVAKAAKAMNESGMQPKFLLMLGDSVSLPFCYYWFPGNSEELGKIPTDNVYADLEIEGVCEDGYDTNESNPGHPVEPMTVELANGRIVAKSLESLSRYADRIFNYNEYLAATSAPAANIPALNPLEWNNNALAYSATGAEFGTPEELQAYELLLTSGFNTQEGSAAGHTSPGLIAGFNQVSGVLVSTLFTMSSLIVAGADHGCPQANSVDYSQLQPMPPNVNFQVSCLTGMIDTYFPDPAWNTVSKDDSYTYSMLDNGCACLVASMRSTYGMLTGSYPAAGVEMGTSGDTAYHFMDNLIQQDCTVGEALQQAKANLGENLISFEYTLYGDPAFNPYEPCNEGSK